MSQAVVASPDPPKELTLDPPRRDRPVNISNTLICSHCRKVLSLAKKTLGSTLVRTSPLALRSACSGDIGLSWLTALEFWKIPDLKRAVLGLHPAGCAASCEVLAGAEELDVGRMPASTSVGFLWGLKSPVKHEDTLDDKGVLMARVVGRYSGLLSWKGTCCATGG